MTLRYRLLNLRRLAGKISRTPNDSELKAEWQELVAEIKDVYLADDRPFLGMCRQLVRNALKDIQLSRPLP